MRILIYFLFIPFLSFSQNDSVDSLKSLLSEAESDFQKINLLTDISDLYQKTTIKKGIPFMLEAVELSEKVESDSLLIRSLIRLGSLYSNSGVPDSFVLMLDRALKVSQRYEDELMTAAVYERYVQYFTYENQQLTTALDFCFKELKIYEEANDKRGISEAQTQIADIFRIQKNYTESNSWAIKGLELGEEAGNKSAQDRALAILAANYSFEENYSKAIEINERMMKMAEADNDISAIVRIYANSSHALNKLKRYDESLKNLEKAYNLAKESDYGAIIPILVYNIGNVYYYQKNYSQAITEYSKAIEIAKETNQPRGLPNYYSGLYSTYRKLGNYKEALKYAELRTELRDSIFNVQKEQVINELNTKYQTEQKEKEIALLSEKEKTQAAEVIAVRNRNYFLLGLLGMLLLGGGVFYYRRQLNEQLRLQSMRTQISSDLHDEVGSSLAQLSMIMGSVEGSDPAVAKSYLVKGNEILMSSISKIRDVVWAIDAGNDATGALLDRMEDFTYDMLSAKNIKYDITNTGFDRKAMLPPLIRQNFYLFYKEGITNISKHSNATHVRIDFSRKGKNISLKIADNGRDLNDKKVTGSGIENMKLRAKKIDGTFDFSKSEEGFSVSLNAPLE